LPEQKTAPGSTRSRELLREEYSMLRWAVIFLVIALIAGLLGFTGIATAAAGIAKFLFYLFLIVCIVLFISGFMLAKKM
jgi:uncharacterized membrane protein YtjA (UPF0391 family)